MEAGIDNRLRKHHSTNLTMNTNLPGRHVHSAKLWFFSCLPIATYFWAFFYFGINAPQFDDFQTVIRSVVLFDTTTDYASWLLSQYGEHRIAYVRLAALLVQKLTGSIDFVAMGLLGNLSLIGVIVIVALWFRRWKLEAYFLPVPFVLFQMHYHHNTFTAMMALQNLTILLWALLTFWWIADGRGWRPWVALIPAILAVYTSGNGLFVVVTVILILASNRQWRLLAIWLVVGGSVITAYFWNLISVKPNYSVSFLLEHVPQIIAFNVFFCGSYFDLFPNVLMSSVTDGSSSYHAPLFYLRLLFPLVTGLFLITGSLLLIGRWGLPRAFVYTYQNSQFVRRLNQWFTYHQDANVFLVAGLVFILLTASVTALGRIDIGLSQSFAIRYKVYAPLLLILCYAALLVNVRKMANRNRFYRLLLPVSVLICVNSYWQHLNQIQNNRRLNFSGLVNMKANKTWAVYGSYYGNIDSLVQIAVDRDMYQLNQADMRPFLALEADLRKQAPTIQVQFDTTTTASIARLRVPYSLLTTSLLTHEPSDGAYFVLYNLKKAYLFSAQLNRSLVGTYQSGFQCNVERSSYGLIPGLYKVAVMTHCNGQRQLFHTAHQVKFLAQR